MQYDAILKDVSEQDVLENQETEDTAKPLTERERLMEEIANRRSGESPEETQEEPEQEAETSPAMVRVKIDGQETDVPLQQVLAQYQKSNAADMRLEEAAKKHRQLAEWEAKLRQYEQDRTQTSDTPKASSTDAPTGVNEDTVAALAKALQYDGEDEVKAALKGVLEQFKKEASPNKPDIDPSAIASAVEAKLQAKAFEQARIAAVQRFNSEFQDIAADPALHALADAETVRLFNDGHSRDPWEILRQSGENVRAWRGRISNVGASEDHRVEAKRMATRVPTQRTMRGTLAATEKPETRADVFAEMRRARGQSD